MKIRFKKFSSEAIIPTFGGGDSSNAGLDLYACLPSNKGYVIVPAQASVVVSTEIGWEPVSSKRCAMIIQSRSGLAIKNCIEASNAGVIDSTYRGCIMVRLYNHSDEDYIVNQHDRIAQGIIYELPFITVEETSTLSDTVRGASGFGSTGR